jgi:hypothetical protein
VPVVGALLARRVYISWPQRNIYPNLFSLLIGPAGQRKTDAVKLAAKIAWGCLPGAAFLKKHLSTEALFEEYCEESGGCPDKVWMIDDANIILSSWTKTDYGARRQSFLISTTAAFQMYPFWMSSSPGPSMAPTSATPGRRSGSVGLIGLNATRSLTVAKPTLISRFWPSVS